MSSRPGQPELLEVGRIGRAHGLRGEVVVSLLTDRTERVQAGSVLVAPSGSLTVASSRFDGKRWVVRFAEVTSREAAEALQGSVLSAEPIDDPEALWVHQVIGCQVVDQDGVERGVVEAVQANPASDLMVLSTGPLVPFRFVTAGPLDGVIEVNVPEGLWDL